MTRDSVLILDAVRTPIGRAGGRLAGIRPDDLAAHVVRALIDRSPSLDPETVDDVYFGNANGAGEDNRNVARMAVLLAGLPVSVPGATVNRLCGSGMEAVASACRAISVGDAELCIAGGVESMSRAPWVLPKPERAYPRGHETLYSTTLGWRMVNAAMPAEWTVNLGEGAEILADRYGISRQAQDEFALRSHRRGAASWAEGVFAREISNLPGLDLAQDECIRDDTDLEMLARLSPVFRVDGTVTAGNSSPLNDGAAALLLGSEAASEKSGSTPLARIAARGVSAIAPPLYGLGPIEASERALARAGISWKDLLFIELNEAFAAQSLACLAEWPMVDPLIVNPHGGAIALGHPLGCSGARLVTTLAHALHRHGGGYGLATMCVGVGQGVAVVLEGL
ncbi:MAG: thiolase family protein [Acidimicrobiales bacterium]